MPMSKSLDGSICFTHYGKQKGEIMDSEMTVTPIDVTSDLIKHILDFLRKRTDMDIGKLTVTCPTSFKQEQYLALMKAIINTGVKVEDLRIVNEPTAAALSYAASNDFKDEIVLVYDIGGGTFDTTVLRIKEGHFRVLACEGNCNIGGVHFDHIIMEKLLERIVSCFNRLPFCTNNPKKAARQKESFIRQCEEIKIILSAEKKCAFSLNVFASELGIEPDDIRASFLVYQADIHYWLEDILKETLDIIDRILHQAGLTCDDITTILLTGGSCQLMCIKELLNNHFGRDICGDTLHAKESVAKGACIISDIWSHNPSSNELIIGNTIIDTDDFFRPTFDLNANIVPYDNGMKKYEGNMKDGLPHGKGAFYDRNGIVMYEGEWKNGLFEIQGYGMVFNFLDETLKNTFVHIQSSLDWEELSNVVEKINVEENACNNMIFDLVISSYDNLKLIDVKRNALKNLNSLQICNCIELERIIVEGGGGWDEENLTYHAPFEFVKTVELKSTMKLNRDYPDLPHLKLFEIGSNSFFRSSLLLSGISSKG